MCDLLMYPYRVFRSSIVFKCLFAIPGNKVPKNRAFGLIKSIGLETFLTCMITDIVYIIFSKECRFDIFIRRAISWGIG